MMTKWKRRRLVATLCGAPVFFAAACSEEPSPTAPAAPADPAVSAVSSALNPGCSGLPSEVPGTAVWAYNWGDALYQRARQVEIDPFGDILVTGYFNGSIDFGNNLLVDVGGEDAWLGKFTPAGAPVWSAQWGSPTPHPLYTRGIALTSDAAGNIFLAGLMSGDADLGGGPFVSAGGDDVFLTKRDPNGAHIWSKLYGDAATQYVQAVKIDPSGDLIVIGYFNGVMDFGTGPLTSMGSLDAFVAKLDGATGAGIWAKSYGDTSYQDVWDLGLDAAGGIYIVGNFGGTVDFGGGPVQTATPNEIDGYALHLDNAGNFVWSRHFDGLGSSAVTCMGMDPSGNIFLSGSFQGSIDFGQGTLSAVDLDDIFLAKLDPAGNTLFGHAFPGTDFQRSVDVAVDSQGNAVVVGRLDGDSDLGGTLLVSGGYEDVFIAQFGPSGNLLWAKNYGDDKIQGAYGVTVDANDDIIVTGRFNSVMDLGTGPLVSAGNRDIFLAKITGARCADPCAGFPDGLPCDDANLCTQVDTCLSGVCTGQSPIACTPADACHLAGLCDVATGACSSPAVADGLPCDDGNQCTQVDTCQAGVCVGASPVVCAPSDACHVAGLCNVATGACSSLVATNGTACDDGNQCNQVDTCQAGVCVGASPVVCAPADACHVAGLCDVATGTCSSPVAANGTACDDGNQCTQVDTCQAGVCVGASPIACVPADACHVAGLCDVATGVCSSPAAADGLPCDDGDLCTQADTCQAGVCVGTTPVVCSASGMCHVAGVCDPTTGFCSDPVDLDGTACDDADACTSGETCQAGLCAGGTSVVCSAQDDCHDVGTCDPATGACDDPALADGAACAGGTCQNGVCEQEGSGGAGGGGGSGSGGGATGAGGDTSGAGGDTSGSGGDTSGSGGDTSGSGGQGEGGRAAESQGAGGETAEGDTSGCSCRAGQSQGEPPRGGAFALAFAALFAVRRRRR